MKKLIFGVAALAIGFAHPAAAFEVPEKADALVDRLLDRIIQREAAFLSLIQTRSPLIETYIQETPIDLHPADLHPADLHPTKDHYFLGRFHVNESVVYEPLVEHTNASAENPSRRKLFHGGPAKSSVLSFLPRGFAQMTVIDLHDFNRRTYRFEYVRREFLGEVRCLVFDVTPLDPKQSGKFIGRIWVEDHDDSIVRFNGTYVPAMVAKGGAPDLYFHFDSWRVNTGGAVWVPAQIYIEEEGAIDGGPKSAPLPRFKAQTRIWDYAAAPSNRAEELTSILIEGLSSVNDQDAKDVSPLESQRAWERQAEENILARLEKGGLLAAAGPVDGVLDAVVNNLIVSSNLNIEAHCRVLLTSPIETFAVGHTIVISRGLIDVLPDEASLALMLAAELSHIALGHRTPTQFAFNNQTMLGDAELLQKFRFARPAEEMASAAKKTVELMAASPYHNTNNAGLFLKALAGRNVALPMLLRANLGDQVADQQALVRLAEFAAGAPALEENKLEQIAALPLGSRVKLNPWNNAIELMKSRPVSLLSPREKMPFEVTPFVLNLTRADANMKAEPVRKAETNTK